VEALVLREEATFPHPNFSNFFRTSWNIILLILINKYFLTSRPSIYGEMPKWLSDAVVSRMRIALLYNYISFGNIR
jgi:hypothetical protein